MKKDKKKSYNVPKKATGGFTEFLNNNAEGIGMGAGIAGSLIGTIDGADGRVSTGGMAASGALAGVGAGAALGPIGMAVGGIAGAIGGIFKGKAAREKEREAKRLAEAAKANQRSAYSKAVLSNYATEGVVGTNYYAKGGEVTPTFEAEEDEVMQGNAFVLEAGKNLASDIALIEGETHANGGTMGAGAGRIFSNQLNSISGKTFAQEAEKLGKQKGKFEKKLDSRNTATKNTGERMLQHIEADLDNLFLEQESMKAKQTSFTKMALGGTTFGYTDATGKPGMTFDPNKAAIDEIRKMQALLGVKQDGAWGPISQAAYDKKFINPLTTTDPISNAAVTWNPGNVQPTAMPSASVPTTGTSRFSQVAGQIGAGVETVAPFLDNIGNAMLQTPQVPKPLLRDNVRLNKDLNVNAELANINNATAAMNGAIDSSTSNSSVARSNKMSAFSRALDARNSVYERKSNYRNQQENAEAMANSEIQASNNAMQNDYLMKDAMRTDDVNRRTSQNITNLSMDIQGIARDRKLDAMDMERYRMAVERNPEVMDSLLLRPDVLKQFELSDLETWAAKAKGTGNAAKWRQIIAEKKAGR